MINGIYVLDVLVALLILLVLGWKVEHVRMDRERRADRLWFREYTWWRIDHLDDENH